MSDCRAESRPGRRAVVQGSHDSLVDGWEVAAGEAGGGPPEGGWLPAHVPGGVADALRAAGRAVPDLDACDWWFRARLDVEAPAPGERLTLHLDGVTPPAMVLLDGERVAEIDSMHVPVVVPLAGPALLLLRVSALGPVLARPRRPRARWRARIADGGLRFVRTTLLGRAPGFAPGPPLVGPWRPVRVVRAPALAVEELSLLPSVDGADGHLRVSCRVDRPAGEVDAVRMVLTGPSGAAETSLALQGDRWTGRLVVGDVHRWWPHTHGDPVLHDVHLVVRAAGEDHQVAAGRVGFRALASPGDVEVDGVDLHVNGVRVFARGAVWTRPGGPTSTVALREVLLAVRDAGANLLRLPGTGTYETDEFLDLCDELGLLVWQDAMLANFDYPAGDPDFAAAFDREVRGVLGGLAGRPCFAVLCGGSEVEQQAAMTGVPAAVVRGPLTSEVLPRLLTASGADALWVPGSPCGGDLPFRLSTGVAHYFGVGGYRRPLEDVRRAGVRFASECLALANLPADGVVADAALLAGVGVPRDVGADWDFADVRDHYLRLLYDEDPGALRTGDAARYLQLSREVPGELAAEVFGEWRRAGSPCRGGLVLWLSDQSPGAGWGVLDDTGRAKPVLAQLRRAWAPVALWTTDEGLDGIDVHVANDRPESLSGRLRVALYRDGEVRVDEADRGVELGPHSTTTVGVEAVLGRFVDASVAYRFGRPGHDTVVVTLERQDAPVLQAFRFPLGGPVRPRPVEELGLTVSARRQRGGVLVDLRSRLVVRGVRLAADGLAPEDDGFCLEPGVSRQVLLRGSDAARVSGVRLTALHLDRPLELAVLP